ncbi:MAG TPA: thioesterase family protein [Ferruginibacter sp.]|nr:thioesterase family protein [Ferruginibacter sp.]HPH89531.1 thioesterase family protein [Ferruginibacter sp.]
MFAAENQIRIHYALTDQMGVVYHGHYAQFYEIGRAEWLRKLNYSYKDIEAMGIIMPVVDIHSRFLRPARYEDLVTVKTILKELPTHHKIIFHHEIYDEAGSLLNTGDVTLYFMDAKTMKRCDMPAVLKEKLEKFFKKDN